MEKNLEVIQTSELSILKIKQCKYCNKDFYMNPRLKARPRYCSDECRSAQWKEDRAKFNLKYRNAVTNKLNENSVEGIDYVECPICHEKHSQLTLTHFKRHGYTSRELIFADYPGFQMTCKKLIDEHLSGNNNPMAKCNTTELQRKQSSPWSIEHYLKVYDGDKEKAQSALNEFLSKQDHQSWNLPTRIEYYLSKGMSKDEAAEALRNRLTTNGLDYYIKKFGEIEGSKKYKERVDKWKNALRKSFIQNGDGRSTLSKLLNIIINLICTQLNIVCLKEKYMHDIVENKNYSYDFCYNNKIIEINGDYWHCNPLIYNKDFVNKNKRKTALEIWDYDNKKLKCAERNGYKVLVIWESEYNDNPCAVLEKCINFINEL